MKKEKHNSKDFKLMDPKIDMEFCFTKTPKINFSF